MPTTRSSGHSTPSTRIGATWRCSTWRAVRWGSRPGSGRPVRHDLRGHVRSGSIAWPGPSGPRSGGRVGLVAIGLVLTAKAGNIGTNHLFEAMLLDRLIGFALGWLALGLGGRATRTRCRPARRWRSDWQALVHPSVGLQLAMLLGVAWMVWGLAPRATGVDRRRALVGLAALGLALVPRG